MTRRFEQIEDKSSKFWEIEQTGGELNIRWGRIGTAGQQQTKSFDTDAKATAALDKLVKEKTGKGYAEVQAASAVTETAPPSAPAQLPTPAATPSVLPADPLVYLSPQQWAHVLPTRRHPGARPVVRPPQPLFEAPAYTHIKWQHDKSDSSLYLALIRLEERLTTPCIAAPIEDDGWADADAVLLAVLISRLHGQKADSTAQFFDALVSRHGLCGAMGIYITALGFDVRRRNHHVEDAVDIEVTVVRAREGDQLYFPEEIWRVRAWLAHAGDNEWAACVQTMRDGMVSLPLERRIWVAVMLPDVPGLADALVLEFIQSGKTPDEAFLWLQLTALSADVRAAASDKRLWHLHGRYFKWGTECHYVSNLLHVRGTEAMEILLTAAQSRSLAAADGLACIGLPEALDALVGLASNDREAVVRLSTAIRRWPLVAMAVLAERQARGKSQPSLASMLQQLVQAHAPEVAAVRTGLSADAQGVLDRLTLRLSVPDKLADEADLPAVLVAPPWLQKTQASAVRGKGVSGLAPLALPPVEVWREGERQGILDSMSDWERQHIEMVGKDLRRLLDELGLSLHRRLPLIHPVLQAAEAAVAAQDADALLAVMKTRIAQRRTEERRCWLGVRTLAVLGLPPAMGLRLWNQAMPWWLSENAQIQDASYFWATHGLDSLPALLQLIAREPNEYLSDALPFGAVEIAPLAARAFTRLRKLRPLGREWLLRHPQHAAAGLIAPALGRAGEARDCACAALRLLALHGHTDNLLAMAARYGREEVVTAVRELLDEDPLDRFPTKRTASMPDFWLPQGWRRPVLRSTGAALPDSALAHLGLMLTFPTNEEVYAGIAVVKEACTPESLAAFMWDCFSAWLNAGAPSKDGWALTMLGHLGSDDTARKLTPYIRAWPGEAAHARAVTGLDVLARIGSDVALMLLNGIAQKVAFKGLQDKAREKIQAIADERGLTAEELEDRLAPDLGLDEQGTLVLDFGPRQFKVGFDEALKPFVRERVEVRDGPRLPDLPKPKKTDDAELGKAAVERFKMLKKDVRTIASQQVLRLEVAMCSRRRWTPEVFQQFLVEHPLVRHLVQRLVWGVYVCEPESSHGGTLQACFRVSEDGSFTDAQDDAWALPEGENLRIGVPHALELPAEDAASFGQLFADYELLQPFVQIGRDTYALTDAERGATELLRWKDAKVPTGRVLGLTAKGWRRGQAQDGGGIWYFSKPLGRDRVIELILDPGIIVGMVDEYPEQTLQEVHVGKPASWGDIDKKERFDQLDAISASELIRDLEALRA